MNPSFNAPKAPRGYKLSQNYGPESMKLYQSMFGRLGQGSFLDRLAGGDEEMFAQLEQPALRQFGELQGGIASRFSGMGMGARKSSGFQNTMNQASQDFAGQLQSQRMSLQRNALNDLMDMSSSLLEKKPYSMIEKKRSFMQQLLEMFGGEFAKGAGKVGTAALFGGF